MVGLDKRERLDHRCRELVGCLVVDGFVAGATIITFDPPAYRSAEPSRRTISGWAPIVPSPGAHAARRDVGRECEVQLAQATLGPPLLEQRGDESRSLVGAGHRHDATTGSSASAPTCCSSWDHGPRRERDQHDPIREDPMSTLSATEAADLFRSPPRRLPRRRCRRGGVTGVSGNGPDVLFVHGWPVSGATFRLPPPHLVDHVTCHVIDLPSAGSSRITPTTPLSIGQHVTSVRRVADLRAGPCRGGRTRQRARSPVTPWPATPGCPRRD